jgi:hypothetical protein
MSDYFDDLAALLRERGVSQERITATIDDLSAYLQESGADPEEEFGPVADFAVQLGTEPETEVPALATATWVWTADIFVDEQRLNEFGDQGWEVEKVDRRGMFVSHRDPERPQRWEYSREVVTLKGRGALVERLAPDGWEPCGTWFAYEYFKRPKAASLGPAAEIGSPPPAPSGRIFFSKRFYLLVTLVLIFWAVVLIGNGGHFAIGAVIGMVIALAVSWLAVRRRDR